MTARRHSEEEAARILERFEQSHNIFSYCVRDVSVWRILRFAASLTIQNLNFSIPPLPRRELLKAVYCGVLDLFRLPRSSSFVALTYASALRIKSSEGYEDIYFDELLKAMPGGAKVSLLNAPGYQKRVSKAAIRPVFDSSIIFVASVVLAKIFPVKDDAGIFGRIAELVQKELKLDDFSETEVRRKFSVFWWRSVLYQLLLRRLAPKAVLAADAGAYFAIHACRRLGIPFVELQHGIFSQNHPDALPAAALRADARHLLLPDHVALYGDYWADRLNGTAVAKLGVLVPVGSAIIERYRLVRLKSFSPNQKKPVLTLTTQGLERDALIKFIRDFLGLTPIDLELNIKLHPAFDLSYDDYATAFVDDRRVRIMRGHENPNTYELIAHSDIHLSVSSACHFDSLGIGTPTVIIALSGYDLVSDLVRSNDAYKVQDPNDLADLVIHRRWTLTSKERSDRYYRQNFVQNLKDLTGL